MYPGEKMRRLGCLLAGTIIVFKSGFKSRAGYNGERMIVRCVHFLGFYCYVNEDLDVTHKMLQTVIT